MNYPKGFLRISSHKTAMDLARADLAEALCDAITALFQGEQPEQKFAYEHTCELCENEES